MALSHNGQGAEWTDDGARAHAFRDLVAAVSACDTYTSAVEAAARPIAVGLGAALMIYWSYESGREDYLDEGVGASAKRLFSVVTHFFTKTRWERLFHQIH